MTSIQAVNASQPRRQFVSAATFENDLFSYSTTRNATTNVTTGTLTAPITGATSGTCPAGRILRENGQKLYPGVNVGVNTFMVGVYDNITLLSGYIDPNSPVFAVYSTQLPAFYANGVDPGPQGLHDEGPPVYTNGNIISVSGDIVTETGGITVATSVTAGTSITSTLGNITAASGEILATLGLGYSSTMTGSVTQLTSKTTPVTLNAPTGTITMNGASLAANTTVAFTLNNSLIDAGDMLLLSHQSVGAIGAFTLNAICGSDSAVISVRNITSGPSTDAIVIQFMLLKG
jgi:hypothetical protein